MKQYLTLAVAVPALALAACGGTETEPTDAAMADETAMADDMTTTGAPVTVTIEGVQPGEGQLSVALQGESGFATAEGEYTQQVAANSGTVTATFEGVTPGSYAAAVVHDTNGDGNIELGAQGPTEAWGLSGTTAADAAPAFAPSSFQVTETGGNATVTLTYPSM